MTSAEAEQAPAAARTTWEANVGEELGYWQNILLGVHPRKDWVDIARRYLTSTISISEDDFTPMADFIEMFPEKLIEIANVGCGPAVPLAVAHPSRHLRMTLIDPLAGPYTKLLEECGYKSHPVIYPIEVENLDRDLPDNHFHIAWSRNALDHSWDPLRGIRNMIRITRPGGKIIIKVAVNEGQTQNYLGLHQWNFRPRKDGVCELWNKTRTFNLNEEIGGELSDMLVKELPDKWMLIIMTKRISGASEKPKLWERIKRLGVQPASR